MWKASFFPRGTGWCCWINLSLAVICCQVFEKEIRAVVRDTPDREELLREAFQARSNGL